MLIQEHWRLKEEIEKWKTIAFMKGWQGVWEPAKVAEQYKDGVIGRSGGVAILTWNGIILLNNEFESNYISVGATLGWGRKRSLHHFSIYGFDTGQTYQHGQSYYERGNISITD
eukprot:12419914-Heterocapsa_arctica.AAC.1